MTDTPELRRLKAEGLKTQAPRVGPVGKVSPVQARGPAFRP